MKFSKRLAIPLMALCIVLLSGCQCWFEEFTVFASGETGPINSGEVIAPRVIELFTFDSYGNGCPPSSTTITRVEFYNGANKLGVGTKSVNVFTFDWNITPGKDGIAMTGISEVVLTAVDQTGTRSTALLKFSVQAP